jgi:hypothetical protein
MNMSPLDVLGPVFHFLDEVIANYGVYLYLVFVWLCLILIAWILGGGLRRKHRQGNSAVVMPGIIITPRPLVESPPPLPIICTGVDSESDDGNEHSFM